MASSFLSSLNRREALRLLSGTALALTVGRIASAAAETNSILQPVPFSAGNSSASVLTPELTEGPYYIDLEKIRRDITEGKPGVPLRLRIKVAHLSTGAPIPGAAVDVWHCDAAGVYSGFNSHMPPPGQGNHPPFPPGPPPGFAKDGTFPPTGSFPPGGPGGPGGPGFGPGHIHKPDNNLTFLRGVQLTDSSGMAEIDTIFPGWYMGRTTHIHVRVHIGGLVAGGRYRKGRVSHTGQIFFPEDMTDRIYQLAAYAKKSEGRTALKDDGIFLQGGSQLARLTAVAPGQPQLGYYGDALLIIDPTATPNQA